MRRRGGFFTKFLILLIICGGIYYYVNTAKIFEKIPPNIGLSKVIYWNLKTPLKVNISDNVGIKDVAVFLGDNEKTITLLSKKLEIPENNITLSIAFPKTAILRDSPVYGIKIVATDNSKWNFFMGNRAQKVATIVVDKQKPVIRMIDQSYKISKGGSAVVVFGVSDKHLKDVYIQTKSGKRFIATPFYKKGYYASLLAWPVQQNSFEADVVATDLAGNKATSRVRLFLNDRDYKVSTLNLTDKFLKGKVTELADEYDPGNNFNLIQRFKFVNETLRNENERVIQSVTSQVPEKMITDFNINPLYPLRNAAKVASFGDHRFYDYNGTQISQSWHLGIDLASTARADIIANNPSVVAFAHKNGIYGNNLILYHGFGLYTLYGHCSKFYVKPLESVKPDTVVARTGMTGLALGDHLHFGVLIQGVEVRPEEWMDKNWMRINIFDILNEAKKIIDKK